MVKINVCGTYIYPTPTGVRVGNSKARVQDPKSVFTSKSAKRRLRKTLYRLGRTDLVRKTLS